LYTRRGDRGETSLYGPKRVLKDDLRVEAYGTIDELNSHLGLIISISKEKALVRSLKEIQAMLFVAGADAATEAGASKKVPRIAAADTRKIEAMADALLKRLPPLKNFILPGGSRTGAMLHVARSVCRRAERRIVTASKVHAMNPELLPFFNRLSSYLFILSRWENRRYGSKEEIWKS
jgi:cob(I)alamin adenosyltransferase